MAPKFDWQARPVGKFDDKSPVTAPDGESGGSVPDSVAQSVNPAIFRYLDRLNALEPSEAAQLARAVDLPAAVEDYTGFATAYEAILDGHVPDFSKYLGFRLKLADPTQEASAVLEPIFTDIPAERRELFMPAAVYYLLPANLRDAARDSAIQQLPSLREKSLTQLESLVTPNSILPERVSYLQRTGTQIGREHPLLKYGLVEQTCCTELVELLISPINTIQGGIEAVLEKLTQQADSVSTFTGQKEREAEEDLNVKRRAITALEKLAEAADTYQEGAKELNDALIKAAIAAGLKRLVPVTEKTQPRIIVELMAAGKTDAEAEQLVAAYVAAYANFLPVFTRLRTTYGVDILIKLKPYEMDPAKIRARAEAARTRVGGLEAISGEIGHAGRRLVENLTESSAAIYRIQQNLSQIYVKPPEWGKLAQAGIYRETASKLAQGILQKIEGITGVDISLPPPDQLAIGAYQALKPEEAGSTPGNQGADHDGELVEAAHAVGPATAVDISGHIVEQPGLSATVVLPGPPSAPYTPSPAIGESPTPAKVLATSGGGQQPLEEIVRSRGPIVSGLTGSACFVASLPGRWWDWLNDRPYSGKPSPEQDDG